MMWNDLKEILSWLRADGEASTPEQSSVDSLMRLVAMSTMASLHEAQQRRENPPHLSDAAPAPEDGEQAAESASPAEPEEQPEPTSEPLAAHRQPDEQAPPSSK